MILNAPILCSLIEYFYTFLYLFFFFSEANCWGFIYLIELGKLICFLCNHIAHRFSSRFI